MIRLLWLFLALDLILSAAYVALWLIGGPSPSHDLQMRILFEIAALAIIQAIREGKV
jgi:hypothetical protein